VPVVGCQSSGELAAVAAPAMTPGQKEFKKLFRDKNKTPPTSFPPGSLPDMALIQLIMDADGIAQHEVLPGSVGHLMILFLYVRGVPQSIENKDEKNELFTRILVNGSDERERLQKIMRLEDAREAGVDHHDNCPDSWVPKYPFDSTGELKHWTTDKTTDQLNSNVKLFTIFKDDVVPPQTKQCSANCYLAAATTCHAYAVMHETGRWKKVDVSTYIRYSFPPSELYNRIMKNTGGQAVVVFEDLSEHKSHLNEKIDAANLTEESCFEKLIRCGAALLTKFHVDQDFRAYNKFSYSGLVTVNPKKKKGHAMVLVGARVDSLGKCWLLVQNWWGYKQFVEMTLEYLQSSKAVLHFPTQKHTKAREPLNVSTPSHIYSEADIDDGGDEEDEEDDEVSTSFGT
jgi:hypothetical protein